MDLWTWVDSRTRLFLSFSSSVLVSAFESNFRSLCTETELFQRDEKTVFWCLQKQPETSYESNNPLLRLELIKPIGYFRVPKPQLSK